MRFAHRQRASLGERAFRRFDVGKEIVVSEQVPNGVCSFAFNCQDTEQSKSAFELKNQVVARDKYVICQTKTAPLESGNSR